MAVVLFTLPRALNRFRVGARENFWIWGWVLHLLDIRFNKRCLLQHANDLHSFLV
jgi:hypothetical protein